MTRTLAALGGVCACLMTMASCGSDDDDGAGAASGVGGYPEQTGAACEAPADCYPGMDQSTLEGDVVCLDKVRGGYCTHLCGNDDDCCAVEGECQTNLEQVCSPFENAGQKMCFISCEKDDVHSIGGSEPIDDQHFCQLAASPDFICRSSGGGSENRKVCVPGDCGVGAACTGNDDCDPDLECLTTFGGGYCGKANCESNADCPQQSLCVQHPDGDGFCLLPCSSDVDCSFCRPLDNDAAYTFCTDDVTFVEAASTGQVCVPWT